MPMQVTARPAPALSAPGAGSLPDAERSGCASSACPGLLSSNLAAVEVKATAYIDASGRATRSARPHSGAALASMVPQVLETLGYEVKVVPEGSELLPGGYTVLMRLPRSYSHAAQSDFVVDLLVEGSLAQCLGLGRAQTALQSALAAAVPDMLSVQLRMLTALSGGAGGVVASFAVATSHPPGTVKTQALQQQMRHRLPAAAAPYMSGSISIATIREAPELAPYAVWSERRRHGYARRFMSEAVRLPGDAADPKCSGQPRQRVRAMGGLVASLLLLLGLLAYCRRRRGLASIKPSSSCPELEAFDRKLQGWALQPSDIEICRNADGSEVHLGSGTFGTVLKAVRGGVQDVAAKLIHVANETDMDKFTEEVGILKGLNYDCNIVQFYGACLHPGRDPMLICEYMEGGNLCQALKYDEELAWYKNGRLIASDIVRGLHFLHTNQVLHGDLKSSNVVLNGAHTSAKICDVGLATVLSDSSRHTRALNFTLSYAAPEVLLGEDLSLKADIFALGVLLKEIVTRTTPVKRGLLHEPRVPEECPADVRSLIADCTKLQPADRPGTKEVFDRLKASAAAHGVLNAAAPLPPTPPACSRAGQLRMVEEVASEFNSPFGGSPRSPFLQPATPQQQPLPWLHNAGSTAAGSCLRRSGSFDGPTLEWPAGSPTQERQPSLGRHSQRVADDERQGMQDTPLSQGPADEAKGISALEQGRVYPLHRAESWPRGHSCGRVTGMLEQARRRRQSAEVLADAATMARFRLPTGEKQLRGGLPREARRSSGGGSGGSDSNGGVDAAAEGFLVGQLHRAASITVAMLGRMVGWPASMPSSSRAAEHQYIGTRAAAAASAAIFGGANGNHDSRNDPKSDGGPAAGSSDTPGAATELRQRPSQRYRSPFAVAAAAAAAPAPLQQQPGRPPPAAHQRGPPLAAGRQPLAAPTALQSSSAAGRLQRAAPSLGRNGPTLGREPTAAAAASAEAAALLSAVPESLASPRLPATLSTLTLQQLETCPRYPGATAPEGACGPPSSSVALGADAAPQPDSQRELPLLQQSVNGPLRMAPEAGHAPAGCNPFLEMSWHGWDE